MIEGSRWDDWEEPSLEHEAVERRGQPRGIIRGLSLTILGEEGHRVDAVEASSKGFFARVDDPDRFRLGEVHDVDVARGAVSFRCRVEVVRKELIPRSGVALRVVRIAPPAQDALNRLVDDA